MNENVLEKCPSCSADVLSGQRFCANCGAEQNLSVKTKKEIEEMREIIKILAQTKSENVSGQDGLGMALFSLSSYLAIDMTFKWVLGHATNDALENLVTKEGKK